jgi:hypothetical protein
MPIDILNSSIGLQAILEPASRQDRLPDPLAMANNTINERGLEKLFDLTSSTQFIDLALRPDIFKDDLLRPYVFKQNLQEAYDELKSSRHPDVRKFVRQDFNDLLEDRDLFETYLGLLMSG